MDLQTPWTVNDRDGDAEGFPPHPYPDTSPWCNHILVTGGEMVVAHINADAGLESAELAEFICRAVNAHEALVRELTHLARLLEPLERDGTLNVPGLATLNGVRSALALAAPAREGEAG